MKPKSKVNRRRRAMRKTPMDPLGTKELELLKMVSTAPMTIIQSPESNRLVEYGFARMRSKHTLAITQAGQAVLTIGAELNPGENPKG